MGKLLQALTEYGQSEFYPYHMPGHKRKTIDGFPKELTDIDITEIEGFDNLHQAEGILLEAQRRAAKAYGADESFYLINGSTSGILTAISTAVPFGGRLLIVRNCHKSVFHAAYLRQIHLSYIWPDKIADFDICDAVTPQQVEAALQDNQDIQAVLIVSPTYEGRLADVKTIAEVVHKRNIPLIVDEAHGAHLGFGKGFAENSCRMGADLVIHSVHKTLPALTQTALLHCNGTLINRPLLRRCLHIYQSSSPSYIMMASIDHAIHIAGDTHRFDKFYDNWKQLISCLQPLKKLKIMPIQDHGTMHDVGKLVISTINTSISGTQLSRILREKFRLEMEMACETYVLAMFTIADTKEGYCRLAKALLEIDEQLGERKRDPILEEWKDYKIQERVPFCEAWDKDKEWISLEDAVGHVAGEFINLYPPGTPIVVPGEVLDKNAVWQIQECLKSGLEVQGVRSKEGGAYREICILNT